MHLDVALVQEAPVADVAPVDRFLLAEKPAEIVRRLEAERCGLLRLSVELMLVLLWLLLVLLLMVLLLMVLLLLLLLMMLLLVLLLLLLLLLLGG